MQVGLGPQRQDRTPAISAFGRSEKPVDHIEVPLTSDEYQHIDDRTAARMLGYFTQKMREAGFPWNLSAAGKPVSELDALRRLKNGEPVTLTPKRNLQLDLSSENLGAMAAAGALSAGAAELAQANHLANVTKSTRVSPGLIKVELRHGEPTEISNFAELKLLHQLNCEEGVLYKTEDPARNLDPVGATANQLSFFTQPRSDFGWRYFKQDDSRKLTRMLESGLRGGARVGLAGAGMGAAAGLAFAVFKGNWNYLLWGAAAFGIPFGALGAVQGARDGLKGKPISTVEALQRNLDGQPIFIQKTTMQGIGVPFLNRLSWYSDDGQPNPIASKQDLDLMYWMANHARPLPAAPPPPPAALQPPQKG